MPSRTAPTSSVETPAMKALLEFVFAYRNYLAALPLVYVFLTTTGEVQDPGLTWSLALAMVFLGANIRAWANRHCNYRSREKNILARTGPYAMSRNPLYVGTICIILGVNIASGILWMLPVTLIWVFAIFNVVVAREERKMLKNYGDDYQAFLDSTPRWFPGPPSGEHVSGFLRDLSAPLAVLALFLVKEYRLLDLWS